MKHQPSKDQLLMGIQPIRELLSHAPEKIIKVYTIESKRSDLLDHIQKAKIPIHFVSREHLNKMVGSDSHQMVIAQIKQRRLYELKEFLKEVGDHALILILDQIFDPQNFGAIIRSAECLGASAVLWSKNRGAELTAVAAKASSGASELIPLIRISNLATAVEQLKKADFEILGAQLAPDAESVYSFNFSPKTALILGSEGEGIQPLLQKKVDRSIFIPMKGKITSLNVAQATTALLALWNAGPRQ